MSIPYKQFEVWLRRQLFQQDKKCTKITIRHSTATSRLGQVLFSISIPEVNEDEIIDNEFWTDWINEKINEIDLTTQADADGSSATGVEKYSIQSFHGDDNKPSGTFNIRQASDNAPDDDGILSEPATKAGLFGQLMRHNEALIRATVMMHATGLQTMQKQLNKQEQVIERLLDDKFRNIDLIEQLLSKKEERELEAAKVAHQMEMKDKMLETGQLLLPAVVNAFSGNKNNETISASEASIVALAQSLTPEQVEKLQGTLTQPQFYALLNLITSAGDKVTKQIKEKSNDDNEQEN